MHKKQLTIGHEPYTVFIQFFQITIKRFSTIIYYIINAPVK